MAYDTQDPTEHITKEPPKNSGNSNNGSSQGSSKK